METNEATAVQELPEWMARKGAQKKPLAKIDAYNLKELDHRLGEVEGYIRDFRIWIQAVRGVTSSASHESIIISITNS